MGYAEEISIRFVWKNSLRDIQRGCRQHVDNMLKAFENLEVNMSLKIHFLHHHLEYFGAQMATESDEQGERFHQTAMPFEKRYVLTRFDDISKKTHSVHFI